MPLHHEIENVRISNYSVGGSPSETEPWTAIAMAESGGNTEAHVPHGEDSLGLWQINIDPAQTDNPDTFDCSEIVQWQAGPHEKAIAAPSRAWMVVGHREIHGGRHLRLPAAIDDRADGSGSVHANSSSDVLSSGQ